MLRLYNSPIKTIYRNNATKVTSRSRKFKQSAKYLKNKPNLVDDSEIRHEYMFKKTNFNRKNGKDEKSENSKIVKDKNRRSIDEPINLNTKFGKIPANIEYANDTFSYSAGIEVTVKIENLGLPAEYKNYIHENFNKYLSADKSTLFVFSEDSVYEIKNQKDALNKMKNLLEAIHAKRPEKMNHFKPFINNVTTDMDEKWKQSKYVKYGPTNLGDPARNIYNWEILPEAYIHSNYNHKYWHDDRPDNVINSEISNFLTEIDYNKRIILDKNFDNFIENIYQPQNINVIDPIGENQQTDMDEESKMIYETDPDAERATININELRQSVLQKTSRKGPKGKKE